MRQGCATSKDKPNLFNQALSRTGDPISSYEAADTVNLAGWHKRIHETLLRHDRPEGYTTKELGFLMDEDNHGVMRYSVSKRMAGMERAGLVERGKDRPSLIDPAYTVNKEPLFETTWLVKINSRKGLTNAEE